MAQDPASGSVSSPEGGTYPSSDEVRAADAEKALTRSEVINEFGEGIGQELLDANIASLSGLMTVDDERKEALSPEAKAAITAWLELNPIAVETVEVEEAGVGEEADVEAEVSEEEAEGEAPEEESVSEGDGDADADSGEGAPEEAVAEGEAPEEAAPTSDEDVVVDEDAVAVDEAAVEEGLDEHEHEVPSPMSYQEAKDRLEEIPFKELKGMAEADGLKPDRSKKGIVQQLLQAWFPEPVEPVAEVQMSARIRRIKESQSQ